MASTSASPLRMRIPVSVCHERAGRAFLAPHTNAHTPPSCAGQCYCRARFNSCVHGTCSSSSYRVFRSDGCGIMMESRCSGATGVRPLPVVTTHPQAFARPHDRQLGRRATSHPPSRSAQCEYILPCPTTVPAMCLCQVSAGRRSGLLPCRHRLQACRATPHAAMALVI